MQAPEVVKLEKTGLLALLDESDLKALPAPLKKPVESASALAIMDEVFEDEHRDKKKLKRRQLKQAKERRLERDRLLEM